MEKIYKVEFMKYTNVVKDTVSNQAKEIKDEKFLRVGKEPFLEENQSLITIELGVADFVISNLLVIQNFKKVRK